jgi:hypothetical protein
MPKTRKERHFLRDRGLSIVLFFLFIATLAGQAASGWMEENHDRAQHAQRAVALGEYLTSGHFIEVTMENWESEFLQMFVFIVFTIFLFQRGSAESKDPDKPDDPEPPLSAKSPAAARAGGWRRFIYEHSMSLIFACAFIVTLLLHAIGGVEHYNEESLEHGGEAISLAAYLGSSRFWFESLQNWQSEFLSLWAMVVASIYFRQRGSPESKPVNAPHEETG